MVFAVGIGAYNISLFHLFNHAFFKALLFLSAGSIIHSIAEEQDLRKMGSIILQLPVTYIGVLIGSLALMGAPFLTGFYSKDAIIEVAYASFRVEGSVGHWLLCLSAGFTAFYSMRLLNACFISNPQGSRFTLINSQESEAPVIISLIILSLASIFIGFLMKDIIIGVGSPYLESDSNFYYHSLESEFIPVVVK
jgi:NADH-ubiquinone oxidoreductase chain 5